MIWPRAILLDFYGTVVVDDDAVIMEISAQVARAAAVPATPVDIARFWSLRFISGCRESRGPGFLLQRDLTLHALVETLAHFRANLKARALCESQLQHWRRPPLFPEAREALERCPVPICLVSNIDNAELKSALRHTGLSFAHIVTSESCRAYKPHPEPFRSALQLLKLPPGAVLHVGDSLSSDVHGAQALGIPALWINRRGRALPEGHQPPDYTAPDLMGLARALSSGR